jgi:HSP20 family protein
MNSQVVLTEVKAGASLVTQVAGADPDGPALARGRERELMTNDPHDWMWSEALQMLARAERMRQQMFIPARALPRAAWEPPVDVLETEGEVLVLAALPGVDLSTVEASIDGSMLVIAGDRALPRELRTAVIHRLELPQGRFERRVPLPPGRYDGVTRAQSNGCLVISLSKSASPKASSI